MSTIAAAVIAGVFSLSAVALGNLLSKVRRDLDACLRERKQLKQVLQLTVSALVGLLPAQERDRLLLSIDAALENVADEAA